MSKGVTPADYEYDMAREKAKQDYYANLYRRVGGVEALGQYRVDLRNAWEKWQVALHYYTQSA